MLTLNNITQVFYKGTPNEKTALSNLSLTLQQGEFTTIIGSNGAGKSTVFSVIAGVVVPEQGSVVLNGKDITFLPSYQRSRDIGYLFQDPMKGTAPSMTIEENLALAYLPTKGGIFRRISKDDREFFHNQLKRLDLGLENRMKSPVSTLSGGQRQGLTLLMATMVPPKILLLDEHTAALDPGTGEKVLHLTQEIVKENNITCLMITHNMKDSLAMGNRTLMMDNGKILLDISGKEREQTTIQDLLKLFQKKKGEEFLSDRTLLA